MACRRQLTRLKKAAKEIQNKFLFFLCKTYQKLPSDSFFEEIDPFEKFFLFCSWLEDYSTQSELLKQHAILTGSFSNPEMAKRMLDKPTFESSDEDFERAFKAVEDTPLTEEQKNALEKLGKETALKGIINSEDKPTSRQSRRKRRLVT